MTPNKIEDNKYENIEAELQLQPQLQLQLNTSIPQGSKKTLVTTLTQFGTPGYIYKLYVDNVLKRTFPTTGNTNNTSDSYQYTFNESIGDHIVTSTVIDSCPTP